MQKITGLVAVLFFFAYSPLRATCVKGNCLNGYGTFVFSNGSRYVGDFADGKPHGKGIMYFKNGNKYIGNWIANFREGKGRMVFIEGHEYFGFFKQNQFSGEGVMTYANGDRYEGDWRNDRPNGKGKYTFLSGHYYEGMFVDGRFEGEGLMVYADGSSYEGLWKAGKKHGQGTYFLADGETIAGKWVEGRREGDEDQSWQYLVRDGGPYDRNCNILFCASGTGHYTYEDGTRYLGEFDDGKPDGEGQIYYSNGDKYVGYWKDSSPHGRGVMYYKGGRVLGAVWNYGRPVERLSASTTTQQEYGASSEETDESKNTTTVRIWALVIGVGYYKHMPILKYTDDDAYQLFAFLKSPEGGAIPDQQIRILVDENATQENIMREMNQLYSMADDNDVILFYFSGHGLEGAFLPFDYDGQRNLLSHNTITTALNRSKAKHKLVLADACHSGSLFAARTPLDGSLKKYYSAFENTSGGLALMMSSKGEEYSLEDGGLRSGVFSHFLIAGLKGSADSDNNRIITVSELFDYVFQKVTYYTARAQTPTLSGSFDPNMPIGMIRQ
jgi:hypothetical protein